MKTVSGKNSWIVTLVLLSCLLITAVIGYYTWYTMESRAEQEFSIVCKEITLKIDTRLHAHAQLLRSGASFVKVSETVTREKWKSYYISSEIDKNLPGIQGLGYSLIIPKNELDNHIESIREEGFPEYTVKPENARDNYTSIIFLEPFNFRNKQAFGYDMFSEPVRRKAMEQARDYNVAALSGKVLLLQEIDRDLQAGTLMYVPVYRQNMPSKTLEERRDAIIGWVYSPYRMNDLMEGILGRWDLDDTDRIHLRIYDEVISDESLLFDSQKTKSDSEYNLKYRTITISVDFNGRKWVFNFIKEKQPSYYLNSKLPLVVASGIIISILIFSLIVALLKTRNGRIIAEQLSSELKENEDKIRALLSEKELILQEVHHRIKNNMTTIQSLLMLHSGRLKEPMASAALADAGNRIHGMMLLYDKLYRSSDVQVVHINDYLLPLIDDIAGIFPNTQHIKIEKHIEKFEISARILFSLGIIINELLTNIMKYAFRDRSDGLIIISASEKNKHITFSIEDNGRGLPETVDFKNSTGFGLMLVGLLTEQINGTIKIERKEGTRIILEFNI